MISQHRLLLLILMTIVAAGCQQKEKEDLSQFVAQTSRMKAKEIEPLPNIKPVEPFAYNAQEFAEPFNVENLKPRQVVSARSGTGPDN